MVSRQLKATLWSENRQPRRILVPEIKFILPALGLTGDSVCLHSPTSFISFIRFISQESLLSTR